MAEDWTEARKLQIAPDQQRHNGNAYQGRRPDNVRPGNDPHV